VCVGSRRSTRRSATESAEAPTAGEIHLVEVCPQCCDTRLGTSGRLRTRRLDRHVMLELAEDGLCRPTIFEEHRRANLREPSDDVQLEIRGPFGNGPW
jgi:hypothetical protein